MSNFFSLSGLRIRPQGEDKEGGRKEKKEMEQSGRKETKQPK